MPPKSALLALAYPLLVHAAIALHSEPLAVASVLLLVALLLGPGLLRRRPLAWLALPPVLLAVYALARADAATLPLYLPPIAVNAGLGWLFGRTLRAGQVPLIERLVRAMHAPDETLDPAIAPYARRLTLAWTLLFVVLGSVNLALAACAMPGGLLASVGIEPPYPVARETWSAFANLWNYLLVAAFFLLEYAWRLRRFPQQPYAGLYDFMRRAAAAGPRLFREH